MVSTECICSSPLTSRIIFRDVISQCFESVRFLELYTIDYRSVFSCTGEVECEKWNVFSVASLPDPVIHLKLNGSSSHETSNDRSANVM